jgi:hypothetical protein
MGRPVVGYIGFLFHSGSPFGYTLCVSAVHDFFRALRVNGPMDRFQMTANCAKCGRKTTETMRWFHAQDLRCPCGGEFDSAPFYAAVGYQVGLLKTPPAQLKLLPPISEQSE